MKELRDIEKLIKEYKKQIEENIKLGKELAYNKEYLSYEYNCGRISELKSIVYDLEFIVKMSNLRNKKEGK